MEVMVPSNVFFVPGHLISPIVLPQIEATESPIPTDRTPEYGARAPAPDKVPLGAHDLGKSHTEMDIPKRRYI